MKNEAIKAMVLRQFNLSNPDDVVVVFETYVGPYWEFTVTVNFVDHNLYNSDTKRFKISVMCAEILEDKDFVADN